MNKKGPIVAVSLLVIILVVWFIVSRMPFGGTGDRPPERPELETISEGRSERGSDTLAPIPELEEELPPNTTTAAARNTPPPPSRGTTPSPAANPSPASPSPASPSPATPSPRPARAASGEITETQAIAVLRGYIASNEQYLVRAECLRIGSLGYRNVGYTLEVYDTCESPGAPRSRWRVDSKTREIFIQRGDGRYLRP